MERKNFISKLFMIGIASVIPKAFKNGMEPIRGPKMGPLKPFIMGQRGPELYIPQTSGKIIPVSKWKLKPNEIREILRFEAYKDS